MDAYNNMSGTELNRHFLKCIYTFTHIYTITLNVKIILWVIL